MSRIFISTPQHFLLLCVHRSTLLDVCINREQSCGHEPINSADTITSWCVLDRGVSGNGQALCPCAAAKREREKELYSPRSRELGLRIDVWVVLRSVLLVLSLFCGSVVLLQRKKRAWTSRSGRMQKVMCEDVVKALRLVREKISAAAASKELPGPIPRLVAVSKTKPKELVIAAYNEGQRHFGENYIQELLEKANSAEILRDCPDIRWHFIGRLQSNKVAKLPKIPNLFMVETLESQKTAAALNSSWAAHSLPPLGVMVQVNTSGEEQKNGIEPRDVSQLVKFLLGECPSLKFSGLMTIGMAEHDQGSGPNPDFVCLAKCREELCAELGLNLPDVELSMGMSADFEEAIRMGSTNVRVGSTIFGHRNYAPKT